MLFADILLQAIFFWMNYLAHIVLSGDRPLHLVGNYAGDFIKGRNMDAYPALMRQGAVAHRAIDSFTDSHASVRASVHIFRPVAGRYSGIIMDVLFDYFISQHWSLVSHLPREKFIDAAETILWNHRFLMPAHARRLLPSLIFQKYLRAYISFYGLRRVFRRMASRTSLPDVSEQVVLLLAENHEELNEHFLLFWSELREYARDL